MANKTRTSLMGFGVNDADYITQVSEYYINEKGIKKQRISWICPYYSVWRSIITRGYCKSYKDKHPTYKDCTVCDEWLLFSNFRKWMIEQDWKCNCLDKDILFKGNKIYSPEKCCFVPHDINCLLKTQRGNSKGLFPIGVVKKNDRIKGRIKKYQSLVCIGGKQSSLGYFMTPDEAHAAWQMGKAKEIIRRSREYESLSCCRKDVIRALLSRSEKLLQERDCNNETLEL